MRRRWFPWLLLCLLCAVSLPDSARADDCPRWQSLPPAREGGLGYERSYKGIYLCDGTSWKRIQSAVTAPIIPTPPLPNCPILMAYSTSLNRCCVILAINLNALRILYGDVTLQLCP